MVGRSVGWSVFWSSEARYEPQRPSLDFGRDRGVDGRTDGRTLHTIFLKNRRFRSFFEGLKSNMEYHQLSHGVNSCYQYTVQILAACVNN